MQWLNDFLVNTLFTLTPMLRNVLIFLFSYAEGLPVIGSIVPGGTIAIMIGSLSQEVFMKPWVAIHLIAMGSFLGDITGFFFGKQLKKIAFIKKYIEQEHHASKWEFFDRHIALIIIFGKLLPVIRSTPSLFAGARNMSKKKYVFYVLIGSYLWSIVGVFGGSLLAQVFGANTTAIIIIGVLVIAISVWAVNKVRTYRKKSNLLKDNK